MSNAIFKLVKTNDSVIVTVLRLALGGGPFSVDRALARNAA